MISLGIISLLSVALLFVHIFTQSLLATRDLGWKWNAGPRDRENKPLSVLAARAARASANYRETYPAFIVLVLILGIKVFFSSAEDVWLITIGAWVWFMARLVYLPLYLIGIPYLRSIAWFIAFLGLVLMAAVILL